jgi:lysyl-tRNA synthetase class 1
VSREDADADGETDEHRVFWADEVADEIEARDPAEPIVLKGAVSPSGIPHVGHLNEILRGYYVAAVLRERGHEVRQLFAADDRDALRKLPRQLADADWTLVELGDVDAGALGRNLGVPYTDIPDPFGDCHGSYGEHFTALLAESAAQVGVPVEVVSTTELYESGAFDGVVEQALRRRERARELLAEFQDSVDDSYVPFMPNCASCGRQLTTRVTGVDLDAGTVAYECVGAEADDREIEGCGHCGEATLRGGKLPWRFEWPAGWAALGVDFEPFGKDHAEGSWPSGQVIAREVFDTEPPVPMVYEWFTLDGQALSSSSGNVVTVPELLELVAPAVLRYFFAKRPDKQRDLDLSRIDRLVEEFDRLERQYFREEDGDGDGDGDGFADRVYPFLVEEVRPERVRIPYTFAAVLGMTDDEALREEMARNEGHIPEDAPEWAVEEALERVERARRWARREDNEYNYRIEEELPDVALGEDTAAALDELAAFVAAGHDGEAIQGEIYETAKRHDVEMGELFGAGYRLLFGEDSGPQLGPFLAALDREFVVRRLRREG